MSTYTKKPKRRLSSETGKWPSLRRQLSALKAAQRKSARRPAK
jgi:hypothetical protein